MTFKNREDAGQQLCKRLKKYVNKDVVVYALPRGGVVLASEIATFLQAPLDLLFAHKIGHPYQPEYAIAAISESGHLLGTPRDLAHVNQEWLEKEKILQMKEIQRKREVYLKGTPKIPFEGKIAIIVDDGIATGLTMRVGILELKAKHPQKIVVAVPIAPKSISTLLKESVDEFVGLEIDDEKFLGSVGAYYEEFKQVEDEEVIDLLTRHKTSTPFENKK